ncbi:hypothetical protein LCGC14_0730880 [marine sediment metagenome]|uniref:Uncharacterized protein n=1 Tax=marine sediment metagenome TaxID=412755 RepID=A0A0F9QDR2_9ZZZZ
MSIRVDQGITCPSCGTKIGNVLEIEVETHMSIGLLLMSILIGLAFGFSFATLAPDRVIMEAVGVGVVTASIAFLMFLRILPRPMSGRLIRETPQTPPPPDLTAQAHTDPAQTLELESEEAVGAGSDVHRV